MEKYYDVTIVESIYNPIRDCNEYHTYCVFRQIEDKFLLQLLEGLKNLIIIMSSNNGKRYEIVIS